MRMNGLFRLCGWLLFVLAARPLVGANPPEPFARLPYLQFSSPELMHIAWRTEGPIEPVIRYGTDLRNLDGVVKGGGIVTRASLGTNGQPMLPRWKELRTRSNLGLPKLHSAPVGTFQYEAKIPDLKPDTTYYYAVYDGAKRLTPEDAEYRFTTQPPVGTSRPYRFWVLGDGGTGREAQKAVYDAMLDMLKSDGKPLDFWIHAGDMAYGTGRDVEFQSRFFESYETTLRNKVCWPTMGNHEGYTSKGSTGVGPYYDAYVVPTRAESGGVASGTEAYYSFNHGNIHFICLDSHDLDRKPGGAMAKWLKADLEKAKADWLIAFWHHPPYTKGSHDSDKEKDLIEMRHYIMPIIEAGGVDLVLTGHSHVYERSMLTDGAYSTNATVSENVILDDGDGDPNGDGPYRKSAGLHAHEGTVQVVTGNAGADISRSGTVPIMRKTIVEHGSVLVDVNGDTLTGRMINRNGHERDVFSIVKRGKVTVTRLSLPWQPPEYKKPSNTVRTPAEPALDHTVLISRAGEWRYLAGTYPKGMAWTQGGFDESGWKSGRAPFGRGQGRFNTPLDDMRGRYRSIYLRREFEIPQADKVTELGLWIDYADGFVAYVNGREAARVNVGRSSGRNAQNIKPREGSGPAYVGLRDIGKYLVDGKNVIAIECHAASDDSLDFILDPSLLMED
jgi:hypothetical protein